MMDLMTEECWIPHKNGKVRFYVIGTGEDVFEYLGWFDMTDWREGFGAVLDAVKNGRCSDSDNFQIMRHDQLITLARNVQYAMEEALEGGESDGSV